MFDIIPKLLSSVASFLFPLFASYKALKTSDPALLTPWLMYWVVLACVLLVESWTEWILVWVPFYHYLRLLFLLYLVLPQTQGARVLYLTYVHPFLEENEAQIEEFIANAHDRLKTAGMAYVKRAIEYLKTNVFGFPPGEPQPQSTPTPQPGQSYTQNLLARFSVPAARWSGISGTTSAELYSFLSSAVSPTAGGPRTSSTEPGATHLAAGLSSFMPNAMQSTSDRISLLASQRAKLASALSALDTETRSLEREDTLRAGPSATPDDSNSEGTGVSMDRSPSRQSGLSKSRSEVDFEKIDAESGAEDESGLRQRRVNTSGGSWVPWWSTSQDAEGAQRSP